MSMFTLAIYCLTTSNFPWFMDWTFQVPMQYCSLQHWTLLSPPDTSSIGCCFCIGSASSFLLELFLCSFLVAYWTLNDMGGFIMWDEKDLVGCFCLFILFMGFSRQGLPFLSPVDHVLSELSSMIRLSWVALHGMAHSLIELEKYQ